MNLLKDYCSIEYGKALPERERRPGKIDVYGSAGNAGSHDMAMYDEPIIVVGRKGNITDVHQVLKPSWVIDTAYAIRPGELLDFEYLYYFLEFKSVHFGSMDQSTAIPSLSRDVLYSLPIIPPSLKEQKRRVNKIKKSFADIDSALADVKLIWMKCFDYRQSLLNSAIQGRLVPIISVKDSAEDTLKLINKQREKLVAAGIIRKPKVLPAITPEEIPFDLPKGWKWVRLGDLTYQLGGGTPSKQEPKFWNKPEVLWVSPKDMKFDRITDSIDKISPIALKESKAKIIPKNSLLIVHRSGILQRTIPVGINDVECTINQDLKAFVPFIDSLTDFIWVNFKARENEFLHNYVKDGVTVQSLKTELLHLIPTPLPPLNIMIETSKKVHKLMPEIHNLLHTIKTIRKMTTALKVSILKKTFEEE